MSSTQTHQQPSEEQFQEQFELCCKHTTHTLFIARILAQSLVDTLVYDMYKQWFLYDTSTHQWVQLHHPSSTSLLIPIFKDVLVQYNKANCPHIDSSQLLHRLESSSMYLNILLKSCIPHFYQPSFYTTRIVPNVCFANGIYTPQPMNITPYSSRKHMYNRFILSYAFSLDGNNILSSHKNLFEDFQTLFSTSDDMNKMCQFIYHAFINKKHVNVMFLPYQQQIPSCYERILLLFQQLFEDYYAECSSTILYKTSKIILDIIDKRLVYIAQQAKDKRLKRYDILQHKQEVYLCATSKRVITYETSCSWVISYDTTLSINHNVQPLYYGWIPCMNAGVPQNNVFYDLKHQVLSQEQKSHLLYYIFKTSNKLQT